MTSTDRAKNIATLLNYDIHLLDANFAAVVKEIEEAVREARIEALSDEDPVIEEELKFEYAEGFHAAREKAKGIAEHIWDHIPDEEYDFDPGHVMTQKEIAQRIGEMEP